LNGPLAIETLVPGLLRLLFQTSLKF